MAQVQEKPAIQNNLERRYHNTASAYVLPNEYAFAHSLLISQIKKKKKKKKKIILITNRKTTL